MRSTTRRAAASAALVLSGALLLSACNSGSGSGSGSASASSAASSTASGPAGGSTASPTTVATTGGGPSASAAPTADSAGCHNLVAPAAVKAAVTRDYGAAVHRGHITPRPHQFLYGQCGGTGYAASAFDLTPGATYGDQVAAQDDGSTRKYFSLAANGTWTLIGSAGFPDTGGCAAQIPQALATLWGGCHPGGQ